MASRLRSVWQQIQQPRLLILVIIVVLIALIAFALATWRFGWDWTGFTGGLSQITTTSTNHGTTTSTVKPPGKTLWDLLQLLIVPIVLAVGGFWLNQIQKRREERTTEKRAEIERKAAERRAKTEREITEDNQREAALQAYINKMSELLIHENLRGSDPEKEVRKIARVRTLTALNRLDSLRKRDLLQFLYESGLIEKDKSIIDLHGANLREANLIDAILSEADLSEVDLSRADLAGANLREADLAGAYLYKTDLNKADLSGANLCGARLYHAILRETILCDADLSFDYFPEVDDNPLIQTNLFEADLSGANMRGANLSMANLKHAKLIGADLSKVNLSYADLIRADLERADLTDADLTDANLKGANVTPEQLKTAKSLNGATMPDGSKHT